MLLLRAGPRRPVNATTPTFQPQVVTAIGSRLWNVHVLKRFVQQTAPRSVTQTQSARFSRTHIQCYCSAQGPAIDSIRGPSCNLGCRGGRDAGVRRSTLYCRYRPVPRSRAITLGPLSKTPPLRSSLRASRNHQRRKTKRAISGLWFIRLWQFSCL